MRTSETEVLIVGAGPVGMMTALLLAEAGVQVEIIDQARRTAAHSYACVLHSASLKLLAKLGLAEELVEHARTVTTAGFYDGAFRRAEIKISELSNDFPYAATLSQSSLENALEERLKERNVPIHWNYRLADLEVVKGGAVALVEQLAQTAKGYIVPEWDLAVQKTSKVNAFFVIGADGHRSMVRKRLGIPYESVGGPEVFNVFEFETEDEPVCEVRVVLDDRTANVLWPLSGKRCRWGFQALSQTSESDPHEKARQSLWLVQEEADQKTIARVRQLAAERAPWFRSQIKEIDWSIRIRFEGRLARQFGQYRCWLVGDAAHQTGPVGGQSMNGGFCEAANLAEKLQLILREGAALDVLESYGAFYRAQWQRLLGVTGQWSAKAEATPWVKQRCARIVPCIPATGANLEDLAGRAGIEFREFEPGRIVPSEARKEPDSTKEGERPRHAGANL